MIMRMLTIGLAVLGLASLCLIFVLFIAMLITIMRGK